MSKKINVNPNYYKDGGREHTEGADKADAGVPQKAESGRAGKDRMQGKEGQPNFIPGEAPVGEPGRRK